jgi:hypothetical protein
VAGSCEHGDEPSASGATELFNSALYPHCIYAFLTILSINSDYFLKQR